MVGTKSSKDEKFEQFPLADLLQKLLNNLDDKHNQQFQEYKKFTEEITTRLSKTISDGNQRGLREEELQRSRSYALLRSQFAGPADDNFVSPAQIVSITPESVKQGDNVRIHMRNAAALDRVGFVDTAGGEAGTFPTPQPDESPGTGDKCYADPVSRSDNSPGAADQYYSVRVPDTAKTGPVTVRTIMDETLTTDWDLRISDEIPASIPDIMLIAYTRGPS
ncbi:hypothetical protein [Nocardia sp. NPDC005745]|uniref:hypothetical protein n=1 Tax=Nocardia sp. NPDC005745 TaxID=3157061 RepID=UPI0033DFFEF8